MTAKRPDATYLAQSAPASSGGRSRRALARTGRRVDHLSDEQCSRLFSALAPHVQAAALAALREDDAPPGAPETKPTGKRK